MTDDPLEPWLRSCVAFAFFVGALIMIVLIGLVLS